MIYESNSIVTATAPDGLRKCGAVTDAAGDPAQNLTSAQEQGNGKPEKQPGKEHGEGVKHHARLLSFLGVFQAGRRPAYFRGILSAVAERRHGYILSIHIPNHSRN